MPATKDVSKNSNEEDINPTLITQPTDEALENFLTPLLSFVENDSASFSQLSTQCENTDDVLIPDIDLSLPNSTIEDDTSSHVVSRDYQSWDDVNYHAGERFIISYD